MKKTIELRFGDDLETILISIRPNNLKRQVLSNTCKYATLIRRQPFKHYLEDNLNLFENYFKLISSG